MRQFDAEMHQYWDTKIDAVKQHQKDKRIELEQRELEVVQLEAELAVREELFEQKMAKAEATALPERMRRLALLQQIERDLCERERCLRQADQKYLAQLTDCELSSVRDENSRLRERIRNLEAQIQRMPAQSPHKAAREQQQQQQQQYASSSSKQNENFGKRPSMSEAPSPAVAAAIEAAKAKMQPSAAEKELDAALANYKPSGDPSPKGQRNVRPRSATIATAGSSTPQQQLPPKKSTTPGSPEFDI